MKIKLIDFGYKNAPSRKHENDAGADVQIKQYSGTMLRSRAVSGKYEVFLSESDLVSTDALENADYIILDSAEMR